MRGSTSLQATEASIAKSIVELADSRIRRWNITCREIKMSSSDGFSGACWTYMVIVQSNFYLRINHSTALDVAAIDYVWMRRTLSTSQQMFVLSQMFAQGQDDVIDTTMPDMTASIHSTLLITFFKGLPSVASKYSELFETNKDDRKELPASIGIAW
ncbi:hypothetical protein C8R45DRAFT_944810 [Mycena sanguinolenta]|nr:hypothetical protein C8R45DRAFT_944810 [Mycena sanguinolenta]